VKAEIRPGISTADLVAKARQAKAKSKARYVRPTSPPIHHRRESPEKGRKGSLLLAPSTSLLFIARKCS